jgi:type I restriction enzyme S subunit
LVLNEYLYQFYGVCDWNPSKGATISRLYNDDLRRIRISFPNIDEQMELVGIMKKLNEKTQSLIHQYQHQLNNLFEMKNSILQKAFNGELSD